MDFSKIRYFERVDKVHQREFVIAHNNCVLCGTVLELKHAKNETDGTIKEEAHCPECELRTRAKIFTMN